MSALLCLKENVSLAEMAHPNCLINALQDLQFLCINHSELSAEGLKVNERIIGLVPDKEKVIYRCDKADLLFAVKGMEEAEREYLAIFEDLPDYDFARYRYALFLNQQDRSQEAEAVLHALLDREDEIDDETYCLAEVLLNEISEG